jgi:hypothetical protein
VSFPEKEAGEVCSTNDEKKRHVGPGGMLFARLADRCLFWLVARKPQVEQIEAAFERQLSRAGDSQGGVNRVTRFAKMLLTDILLGRSFPGAERVETGQEKDALWEPILIPCC